MTVSFVEIALVVMQVEDGRLVMQRRDGGAPISPWLLGFFGGHIEPGETAAIAARRELEEETSLSAAESDIRPITTFTIDPPNSRPDGAAIVVHVFSGTTASAQLPSMQVFEGSGFEVYGYDEVIARDDLAPTAMAVLLDETVRAAVR